jgi:uncharacterized cupredoxin-like copper-binding protein
VDRFVTKPSRLVGGAVVSLLLIAGVGCSPRSSSSDWAVVRITERDFHISAPKVVPAGDTILRIHNRGPDAHELIVVKTADGRIPMRGDGLTADEDAVERNELGALEPGAPGSVRELKVRLTPGRYVLFCNMSGHYLGGMSATLVVR